MNIQGLFGGTPRHNSMWRDSFLVVAGIAVVFGTFASSARAGAPIGEFIELIFDTELTSLALTGGPFPIPLASDPGNALGDSIDGYGFVDTLVTITLSSQREVSPGPPSVGRAFAFNGQVEALGGGGGGGGTLPPVDPGKWDGQSFFVDSFFDVFFDITVTDVDSRPGRDYAGMPDGTSLPLMDNGPASMQSSYLAIFDQDAANFGLIPPPEVAASHWTLLDRNTFGRRYQWKRRKRQNQVHLGVAFSGRRKPYFYRATGWDDHR